MRKSTRTILLDHIENEDRDRVELKKCILDNSCRFKDGEIIAELRNKNTQQNGSLVRLETQSLNNANKIHKILNIAEGRKSVWKEVAIFAALLSGFAAFLALIL